MTEKFSRIGMRILMLAGLFAQGLCLAFFLKGAPEPAQNAQTPPTEETAVEPAAESSNTEAVSPLAHRNIAEGFLKANDPVQAIPHLLNAAPKRLSDSDDQLKFRIALCWEVSQSYSRAADLYKELFASSNQEGISHQARIGFARCKIRLGETAAAKSILWRLVQNSQQTANVNVESDSAFWLAAAYTNGSRPTSRAMVHNDFLVRSTDPPLNIERQLEAVGVDQANPKAVSKDNHSQLENTQLVGTQLDSANVQSAEMVIYDVITVGKELENFAGSFYASHYNLYDAFRRLTTEYKLNLEITELASQLASQHSLSLSLPNASLIDALDAITQPYGLGYKETGGAVAIFSLNEVPDAIVVELGNGVADRLLQKSELISQNDMQFGYARFIRAGLLVEQGKLNAAIAIYSDLLQRRIDAQLRQAINFNLGQVGFWTHQSELAIQSFGRAADSNHRLQLQALSFLKIGQISIASGDFAHANLHLSRAAAIADSQWIRAIAKLNLVSSYLLAGQTELAQKNIPPIRNLTGPQLAATAKFLAALTHYKLLDSEPTLDQRERLLSSLSQLDWPAFMGVQGDYLIADAYWNLGFNNEAVEYLQKNGEQYLHSKIGTMQLERLVAIQLASGQYSELKKTLQRASRIEGFDRNGMLSYRFADLAFREGSQEECLGHCHAVLSNSNAGEYHSGALVMLGQIYSSRGEHSFASLCFAGLLPQPSKNETEMQVPQ